MNSIESTHKKIATKISILKSGIAGLKNIIDLIRADITQDGKKHKDAQTLLDFIFISLTMDQLEQIEINYNLAISAQLAEYYFNPRDENLHTDEYYRIINSENFIAQIDDIVDKLRKYIDNINKIEALKVLSKPVHKELDVQIGNICREINTSQNIEIDQSLERLDYDKCKCGGKMVTIPELSELNCASCGKIKKILGVVFRDDQFYPQEGQKSKHGGYDTGRHYKFWMERIQALENKTFSDKDRARIEYVINRDKIDRKSLSVKIMRAILQEEKLTIYNDHAALLVVQFGGPSPPQLDYQENRKMYSRFHRAMVLYDQVVPNGGNKPYYPYFIYKQIEDEFRGNNEKLRLLDYIHLQSRETVIKNDKIYEKICECTRGEPDAFNYIPTDPYQSFHRAI